METMKLQTHIGADDILQNAWEKPTTKKSISDAITRMQQLRQEVALDKTSIRSMIELNRLNL